ncbi:MAG: hypothetical protein JXA77_13540 [Bacteroidales bacterium]|nr:hypothetical protein [Bacteroidales bacterium]
MGEKGYQDSPLAFQIKEFLGWKESVPSVALETVKVAKEFLDAELTKYESWDHVNKSIKMMFDSNSQFQNCKKNGVGQTTIKKFLGGNWKQWEI